MFSCSFNNYQQFHYCIDKSILQVVSQSQVHTSKVWNYLEIFIMTLKTFLLIDAVHFHFPFSVISSFFLKQSHDCLLN